MCSTCEPASHTDPLDDAESEKKALAEMIARTEQRVKMDKPIITGPMVFKALAVVKTSRQSKSQSHRLSLSIPSQSYPN